MNSCHLRLFFFFRNSDVPFVLLQPVAHSPQAQLDQAYLSNRDCPIRIWVVGDTRFSVSYSSYGQKSQIVNSGALGNPSILTLGGGKFLFQNWSFFCYSKLLSESDPLR